MWRTSERVKLFDFYDIIIYVINHPKSACQNNVDWTYLFASFLFFWVGVTCDMYLYQNKPPTHF